MILFGPETVLVEPAVKRRNGVGGYDVTYGGEQHTVTGLTVQPAEVSETETQNTTRFTLRGRGRCTCHGLLWPWGSKTRVTTSDGREFDQNGEAQRRQVGTFTKHVQVELIARSGVV